MTIIDGWKITKDEDGNMHIDVTPEQIQKTNTKNYRISGIPDDLQRQLVNLDDTQIKDEKNGHSGSIFKLSSFITNPQNEASLEGSTFVFLGNPGSGKSQLASSILMELINQKRFGVYMNMMQFKKEFASFKNEQIQKQYEARIKKMMNADVKFLVLDDFGAELSTESNLTYLLSDEYNRLFRKWRERGGVIILTSNLKIDNIKALYNDKRLNSILFPEGTTFPFIFKPRDFRGEKTNGATELVKNIFGGTPNE